LVGPGTARPLKPEIAFDTASLCASRDFVHQGVKRLFHKYHLNDLMVCISNSKGGAVLLMAVLRDARIAVKLAQTA
jgi:hypothetical protein